jgi:hypothetical protein
MATPEFYFEDYIADRSNTIRFLLSFPTISLWKYYSRIIALMMEDSL